MSDIFGSFAEFWNQLPYWVHTTFFILLFAYMISTLIHVILSSFGKEDYHIDCSRSVIDAHTISDNINNNISETYLINEDLPLNCVNCGAPLNGNSVCEYCGTVY